MICEKQKYSSINIVDVSISKECYENKNTDWKNVKYERQRLTIEALAEKLRLGFCACHCFNTDKAIFGINEKTNDRFEKADMVFIDVDDCEIEMNEFVAHLSKQPTLYYTTPSNHTAKSNYLYRFRLVYWFTLPVSDVGEYKSLYNAIIGSIKKDIPTFECKDNCGGVASQQFGGNSKADCDMCITNNIFCFSDFPCENDTALPSLSLSVSHGKSERNDENKVKVNDTEFMRDFFAMQPTKLISKYANRYPFFESTPLDYQNGYAIVPDDYREIYREWYFDFFEKDNGTKIRTTLLKRIRNGEHRRRKLFFGALIRKQILPTITFEHLLYNLVYEREFFFDNNDETITNKVLVYMARRVVGMPIEKITINSVSRRKPKFKVDKSYCQKHGIKPNAYKNVVRKKLKNEEIGSVYDCAKSVAENLSIMKGMGMQIGKSKLYLWCKENGIPTNPNKKVKPKPQMVAIKPKEETSPNASNLGKMLQYTFFPILMTETEKRGIYVSPMTDSCINNHFVSI